MAGAIGVGADIDALPKVELKAFASGKPLIDELSPRFMRETGIYLYEDKNGIARAVVATPEHLSLVQTLEWTLQRKLRVEQATPDDIRSALLQLGDGGHATEIRDGASIAAGEADDDTVETLRDLASGAPIVRAVNDIIEQALNRRATDIHLEPIKGGFRVRIRIDGLLTTLRTFGPELARPIVSRVKILASLNIAERRRPQDGRTKIKIASQTVDIRVATMPTAFGEAAILRLLRHDRSMQAFADLGLSERDYECFARALKAPHGLIIVTGPTGSGKTTTLASALSVLNDDTRKILTVEDPIEYEISGISQSQVQPAIGLTFATALRAFLRQDPDVIMVGEMRDSETARVGIQASLTGHLVLTSLHTNTAAAAVTRLMDLEIEPFFLSASLRSVVAQRLVRKLCRHCRQQFVVDDAFLETDPRFRTIVGKGEISWAPQGCERCSQTGYSGRRAVFEVVDVNEELRHMINHGSSEQEIEKVSQAHGMTTLIEDGVRIARAGETSLQEVLRVTASR